MRVAFKPAYEPALLGRGKKPLSHPRREQQAVVDQIIAGDVGGQYWMFLGPKVTLDLSVRKTIHWVLPNKIS